MGLTFMVPDNGDSDTSLTVDSAASAIEGLLSPVEDPQPDSAETPDTPEEATASTEETEVEGDEPASEETEEEPADDEETPDAIAATLPKTIRVKVDGKDEEVTLDEAIKGYSRQADYTRKTQQHAEAVRAFETEQVAVRAERQRYATQLTELETVLASQTAEPDWDALRNEDPAVFAQTHAAWQINKDRLAQVRAAREEAQGAVNADNAKAFGAHLAAEHQKFAEIVPDWTDAEKGKALRKDMLEYGAERGYSADDLNGITDHRALVVLHKAMLYDKAQVAAKKAAEKGKGKVEALKLVTPGAKPKAKSKTSDVAKAKERLAQTGSVQDAATIFETMF